MFDSISSSQRNLLRTTPTNPPEDQADDLSEISGSTSDEDMCHDSLLHPLPSYIGTQSSKNSSKKEETKSLDDTLMVAPLIFPSSVDILLFMGFQFIESTRYSVRSTVLHNSNQVTHSLITSNRTNHDCGRLLSCSLFNR